MALLQVISFFARLRNINPFDDELWPRIVKWCFTWGLALLPIIFLVLNQYLDGTNWDLNKICSNGEIFLVSIVMVAEPLGDIILAERKSTLLLIVAFSSIFFITSSTYVFSVVNFNEKMEVQNTFSNDSLRTQIYSLPLLSNPNKSERIESGETKKMEISRIEIKVKRLRSLSEVFVISSFFLGLFSIFISNLE